MKKVIFYAVCGVLFITSNAVSGPLVPNVFSNGDVISSSKMNQNFNSLESSLNNALTDIGFINRSTYSDGNTSSAYLSELITMTCNAGEMLTGGSCSCSSPNHNPDTTNFGVLSFCSIAGNSVIGGCYSDEGTLDPTKYGSPVTVYAVCTSPVFIQDVVAIAPNIAAVSTKTEPKPQEPNEEALTAINKAKSLINKRVQLLKNK